MKRSSFAIVITLLLVAAFFLCVILVQKNAQNDGETFFVKAPVHTVVREV